MIDGPLKGVQVLSWTGVARWVIQAGIDLEIPFGLAQQRTNNLYILPYLLHSHGTITSKAILHSHCGRSA